MVRLLDFLGNGGNAYEQFVVSHRYPMPLHRIPIDMVQSQGTVLRMLEDIYVQICMVSAVLSCTEVLRTYHRQVPFCVWFKKWKLRSRDFRVKNAGKD